MKVKKLLYDIHKFQKKHLLNELGINQKRGARVRTERDACCDGCEGTDRCWGARAFLEGNLRSNLIC